MRQEYSELIDNHAILARSNRTLLERIIKNPTSFKRSDFNLESIEYGPVKFQVIPTFFNRAFTDQAQRASRRVTGLVKSLPRRIFGLKPKKIADYYEITLDTAEYLMRGYRDEHVDAMLGRGDFILSSNGLKCLELSLGAKLGGWEQQLWRSVYMSNPEFVNFLKGEGIGLRVYDNLSLMIKHIISHSLQAPGDDGGPLHCAVVMPSEDMGKDKNLQSNIINHLYQTVLTSCDSSLQGELFLCEDMSLESRDGTLYYGEKRVSIVVELNHGMIPQKLYQAYVNGSVVMFNGPLTGILSNKLNLALLSDPRYSDYFSEQERQLIQECIPWTRKTTENSTDYLGRTIDLKEFVLANKDRLLLKPADGVAGFGISVGRAMRQDKWELAVEIAFEEKKWVVQDYVEALHFLYQSRSGNLQPHKMVWGFFQFGTEYAGCLLRLMELGDDREIINSHQGAEVSVVFEIDEQET